MKILAVNSSAKTASAALLCDGRLIASASLETKTHSAVLLPMIERMLSSAGTAVRDMDLMAVTVGPGSFTGVRIGVSLVKGLAFADHIPCVGVSSLEAMAYAFAGVDAMVVPVIDARRETAFTALFRTGADGSVCRLTEDEQLPLDGLMDTLEAYGGERIYFTGDAAAAALAHPACPECAAPAPGLLNGQAAYGAGVLAYNIYTAPDAMREDFTDAALIPSYLKKSQAERERDERNARETEASPEHGNL